MTAVIYTGYSRAEILAVMNMYNVAQDLRVETLKKLAFMENVLLKKLNS